MGLFVEALEARSPSCTRNGVRLRFIGERARAAVRLQARMAAAEERTAGNTGLQLQIAMSYGGRWDIVQAAQRAGARVRKRRSCGRGDHRGALRRGDLALAGLPDPDLFIRTGGEQRISNFLLWNWPTPSCISPTRCGRTSTSPISRRRCAFFAGRERRFGQVRRATCRRRVRPLRKRDRSPPCVLASLLLVVLLVLPPAVTVATRDRADARRRLGVVRISGCRARCCARALRCCWSAVLRWPARGCTLEPRASR